MRPENEARLRKIERISEVLRVVCKGFLGLCGLLFLYAVLGLTGVGGIGDWFGSGGARLVVAGLFAVIAGLAFKCGYHLDRLLGNYSRGEVFTKESAEQIRQWGLACALWGVAKYAIRFLPRVPAIRELFQPGEVHGLGLIVNGLIIVAISWFMAMAAEMREEQDLIV